MARIGRSFPRRPITGPTVAELVAPNTGTTATAAVASVTVTAYGPLPSATAFAALATASVVAYNAVGSGSASVSASPGAASIAVTAYGLSFGPEFLITVEALPGVAAVGVTAYPPGISASANPTAGTASVTVTGQVAFAPNGTQVSPGTGIVLIAAATNEDELLLLRGFAPFVRTDPTTGSADVATITATAWDPSVSIGFIVPVATILAEGQLTDGSRTLYVRGGWKAGPPMAAPATSQVSG
jgi:hypothetical protein